MYTHKNFRTKKELKQAVANYLATGKNPVTYYQPGNLWGNEIKDGMVFLEGPHYPEPHKWWGNAIAENGIIIKVK